MNKIQIPRGYRNSEKLRVKLLNADATSWTNSGKHRFLKLFKEMSQRVPAYKKFLLSHGIKFQEIKNFTDLKKIPAVDKDNYLRKYPKEMLCWDGMFGSGSWVISTTSGSTGQPYYFPRQASQDWQYAVIAEQYLLANFDIDHNKTLYIVGFPMGAWIGGVFTYEAIKKVAENGYDLSIITPGIHKIEIINAIEQLSGSFDQIILGAYAPFLRDILEDGEAEGIDWKAINIKFVFSAEAFSEQFRDYVAKKAGLRNIYLDTLNHYGTVDLGTMAHETPMSILIRRKLFEYNIQTTVFPEAYKQPTLCQYNPELFYFEETNNNLYCSAYSGLPLFRYNLKDYGGVISFKEMKQKLEKAGIDIDVEMKKAGLASTKTQLPFVYVYERNDFSVSYYAFSVYPDPVRKALQSSPLESKLTGKFTMESTYFEGRQHLIIHVECRRQATLGRSLETLVQQTVHEALMRESTEYPEIYKTHGDVVKPLIKLYEYEDNNYFKPGTKQKWIKK